MSAPKVSMIKLVNKLSLFTWIYAFNYLLIVLFYTKQTPTGETRLAPLHNPLKRIFFKNTHNTLLKEKLMF